MDPNQPPPHMYAPAYYPQQVAYTQPAMQWEHGPGNIPLSNAGYYAPYTPHPHTAYHQQPLYTPDMTEVTYNQQPPFNTPGATYDQQATFNTSNVSDLIDKRNSQYDNTRGYKGQGRGGRGVNFTGRYSNQEPNYNYDRKYQHSDYYNPNSGSYNNQGSQYNGAGDGEGSLEPRSHSNYQNNSRDFVNQSRNMSQESSHQGARPKQESYQRGRGQRGRYPRRGRSAPPQQNLTRYDYSRPRYYDEEVPPKKETNGNAKKQDKSKQNLTTLTSDRPKKALAINEPGKNTQNDSINSRRKDSNSETKNQLSNNARENTDTVKKIKQDNQRNVRGVNRGVKRGGVVEDETQRGTLMEQVCFLLNAEFMVNAKACPIV